MRTSKTLFSHINDAEASLLFDVCKANNNDELDAFSDMELIDNLLGIQRMQVIIRKYQYTATGRLRKDATTAALFSNALDVHLEESKILNNVNQNHGKS